MISRLSVVTPKDYIYWALVIVLLFSVLIQFEGYQTIKPISPQAREILSIYRTVYYLGMAVSSIFLGSLIWIIIKFRDNST